MQQGYFMLQQGQQIKSSYLVWKLEISILYLCFKQRNCRFQAQYLGKSTAILQNHIIYYSLPYA